MKLLKPKKLIIFIAFSSVFTVTFAQEKIVSGEWMGNLTLNQETKLPFRFVVKKEKNKTLYAVQNAEEVIRLTRQEKKGDTISLAFPDFHSTLTFVVVNKKRLIGYWKNWNKGTNYTIPFDASFQPKEKNNTTNQGEIIGRWKTTFEKNFNAVGIFKSFQNGIAGTFLTETGDYRFLEGKYNPEKNSFYLSCFDGSHAFLFTGRRLENGTLTGQFYSGNHYSETWQAERNETFQLRNPDSLTYVVSKNPFSFKVKDLEANDFTFPTEQFKNKVTIIQIMGTWCPNCMDETNFLRTVYDKYHNKGLEIVSVGYETPNEFSEQVEKIKTLQKRHNLPFTFLVGGKASKALSSEQFSMLNEIISFPTAIIIGRDGEVKRVHTGFNGPGTGKIYTDFVQEMNLFLEKLLAE